MSRLEPSDRIESIVGASRSEWRHLGRAVSDEERVYILHSKQCRETFDDLRDCPYSLALDLGIDLGDWDGMEDRAVVLGMRRSRLFPVKAV